MDRPITIAVLAIGGQGGGVLVDWIVALAERQGWRAQSTSVPGVAQRTGATIYYVEAIEARARPDAGVFRHGRAGRRRYRYCRRMDGGRAGDPARPGDAGPDDVDRLHPPHLRGVGKGNSRRRHGGFRRGDRRGAGGVPAVRGVRHGGVGGTGRQRRVVRAVRCPVRNRSPAVPPMPRSRQRSPRPASACRQFARLRPGLRRGRRTSHPGNRIRHSPLSGAAARWPRSATRRTTRCWPAPPNFQTPRTKCWPRACGMSLRIRTSPTARPISMPWSWSRGSTVSPVSSARPRARATTIAASAGTASRPRHDTAAFTETAAKYIARAMAYDDVIRVAALKTQPARSVRMQREMGGEIIAVTEFMHPRMEEFLGLLPPASASRSNAAPAWWRCWTASSAAPDVSEPTRSPASCCSTSWPGCAAGAAAPFATPANPLGFDAWLTTVRAVAAARPCLGRRTAGQPAPDQRIQRDTRPRP